MPTPMMRYYIVDAFTDRPFGGNPAGVVLLDEDPFPSDATMRQVAAELRYSETAFVRRLGGRGFHLRYFTPLAEVELCGHATVATFALLWQTGLGDGSCRCLTAAGDLEVEVAGGEVAMQMATPSIRATIADSDAIYEAVGLAGYRPELPVQTAYAGLADIMAQVPDVDALQSLSPDMEAIARATSRHKAVSLHVFALTGDGHTAHVRDFAPQYGVPEESATGTANAALTHYLWRIGVVAAPARCSFVQGEAMGRPSVVKTRLAADGTITVGGTAAVVAMGTMLPDGTALTGQNNTHRP